MNSFPLRPFWTLLICSWLLYGLLTTLASWFRLYEFFPGYGFIGYGLVIIVQLLSLNAAVKRIDYTLVGLSLIVIGAIASMDMILNKQNLAELWILWDWFPLTPAHIDGYVQILLILLNIFTGSIAGQCLFYSATKNKK